MKSNPSKKYISQILLRLEGKYPTVRSALNYKSALELVVATILSAQCTDKRVNMVTPRLFAKYRSANDYAKANLNELKKMISSINFFNNKAKYINNLGKILVEDYNAQVPDSIDELIKLPGIGRKTANVVLHGWFEKNEGIAVDTHVGRLSSRLGLTEHKDPKKIERDLVLLVKEQELGDFGLRLIELGRETCKARKPDCKNCFLNDICPSVFKVNS